MLTIIPGTRFHVYSLFNIELMFYPFYFLHSMDMWVKDFKRPKSVCLDEIKSLLFITNKKHIKLSVNYALKNWIFEVFIRKKHWKLTLVFSLYLLYCTVKTKNTFFP